MAARSALFRLTTMASRTTVVNARQLPVLTSPVKRYLQATPPSYQTPPPGSAATDSTNPVTSSMSSSTTPSGSASNEVSNDPKNAAFLGEADSDDGFEADVETYPEAHRHKIDDANVSGMHGQAGEGDEPIERERKPHEAIDEGIARNAAHLGEADSDDSFEADVEAHPEAHRHRIEDASVSGLHGQAGEGDGEVERERRG